MFSVVLSNTMKYIDPQSNNMVNIPPKPVSLEENAKREDVKSAIRACILTRKNGMPISEIRDEYRKIIGEEIPYLRIGYNSIFHLMRDIPEVKSIKNDTGAHVLIVEPNKKTEHLHRLIAKQKDPRTYTTINNKAMQRKERSYREKVSRQVVHDKRRVVFSSFGSSTTEKTRQPPLDEMPRPSIITTPNVDHPICTEPIVGTSQLMGDDYFLQLCIKYLPVKLERINQKSALTVGTVQSGMTIKKAADRLDNIKIITNKLVINLGTVDIYNRRTCNQMIKEYKNLLEKLRRNYGLSPAKIILCTIPPLGNISFYGQIEQYMALMSFNNWLRDFSTQGNYRLLDLFESFTTEKMTLNYDLFQQDARMVSGTPHPHLLWNFFGRQKAMKLLLNV
ncbi:maternal effect protein oskar [Copidosoma floridanum]|uniref:maternal effect protein oskar n=1 Tax=Copidosoma floridanum TaxID=29053 RepID=UPI0006C93C78|nr:maternal effect protein oskar [Copidosoma floridanum]